MITVARARGAPLRMQSGNDHGFEEDVTGVLVLGLGGDRAGLVFGWAVSAPGLVFGLAGDRAGASL